jgi:predicted nucleic acid-binding protein
MSVFVDTGVFYADHDRGASRHEVADEAVDVVYRGELGQPYTSDYVYDEAVTLTLKRSGQFDAARSIDERIRGAGEFVDVFSLLHVRPSVFETAIDVFEQYDDQRLSFTDATTVALVEENDVDAVLSFDDDFDGIVERIEPGDLNG